MERAQPPCHGLRLRAISGPSPGHLARYIPSRWPGTLLAASHPHTPLNAAFPATPLGVAWHLGGSCTTVSTDQILASIISIDLDHLSPPCRGWRSPSSRHGLPAWASWPPAWSHTRRRPARRAPLAPSLTSLPPRHRPRVAPHLSRVPSPRAAHVRRRCLRNPHGVAHAHARGSWRIRAHSASVWMAGATRIAVSSRAW